MRTMTTMSEFSANPMFVPSVKMTANGEHSANDCFPEESDCFLGDRVSSMIGSCDVALESSATVARTYTHEDSSILPEIVAARTDAMFAAEFQVGEHEADSNRRRRCWSCGRYFGGQRRWRIESLQEKIPRSFGRIRGTNLSLCGLMNVLVCLRRSEVAFRYHGRRTCLSIRRIPSVAWKAILKCSDKSTISWVTTGCTGEVKKSYITCV